MRNLAVSARHAAHVLASKKSHMQQHNAQKWCRKSPPNGARTLRMAPASVGKSRPSGGRTSPTYSMNDASRNGSAPARYALQRRRGNQGAPGPRGLAQGAPHFLHAWIKCFAIACPLVACSTHEPRGRSSFGQRQKRDRAAAPKSGRATGPRIVHEIMRY